MENDYQEVEGQYQEEDNPYEMYDVVLNEQPSDINNMYQQQQQQEHRSSRKRSSKKRRKSSDGKKSSGSPGKQNHIYDVDVNAVNLGFSPDPNGSVIVDQARINEGYEASLASLPRSGVNDLQPYQGGIQHAGSNTENSFAVPSSAGSLAGFDAVDTTRTTTNVGVVVRPQLSVDPRIRATAKDEHNWVNMESPAGSAVVDMRPSAIMIGYADVGSRSSVVSSNMSIIRAASTSTSGYSAQSLSPPAKQQDYYVHSILATIFCFVTVGPYAIVNAKKARQLVEAGDEQSSIKYSNRARTFFLITVVIGMCLWVCFIIVLAVISARVQ